MCFFDHGWVTAPEVTGTQKLRLQGGPYLHQRISRIGLGSGSRMACACIASFSGYGSAMPYRSSNSNSSMTAPAFTTWGDISILPGVKPWRLLYTHEEQLEDGPTIQLLEHAFVLKAICMAHSNPISTKT